MKTKLSGKTYQQRLKEQTNEWLKGNPIHNDVDGECCPDFSCCVPHLLASEPMRKQFCEASEEKRMEILMTFLGRSIASKFPDKDIEIIH